MMNCPYCNAQCKKRWTTSQPQYEPDGFVWICSQCEWDQENNPILAGGTFDELWVKLITSWLKSIGCENVEEKDADWFNYENRGAGCFSYKGKYSEYAVCFSGVVGIGVGCIGIQLKISDVDPRDPSFDPDEFFTPLKTWLDRQICPIPNVDWGLPEYESTHREKQLVMERYSKPRMGR